MLVEMDLDERPKYYTPNEVSVNNTPRNLWVSFLGHVYNLTPLADKFCGDVLLKPIVANGGKDITHWFDKKTKDIRMHIDPVTNCQFPYTPMARFIHTPPLCPRTDWANDFGRPWWKDDQYKIGVLSAKTRKVRIVNTLTSQEQTLEVCSEEILDEIQDRYLVYNKHASSYTWKFKGSNLGMDRTLEDNGVKDESEEFYKLGMDEEQFLPALHIYFNDDLTTDDDMYTK